MPKKKSSSLTFFFLFLALLFFSLESCQKNKPPTNFILITLDTQRADYVSAYSRSHASTPNIDFLARQGTLFENCYSLIPITLPSHASILYSLTPHDLKIYNNGQIQKKKKGTLSLVTLFKKRGFKTGAFVSLGVLTSNYGLDESFDDYQDDFPGDRWYLTAEEINQRVFPWIEKNKDQRFFLWIHYSDPHDPYAPPGMPPDLKLYLNDQLVGEYSLDKYTTLEANLNLNKGKNQLRFEIRNNAIKNPDRFKARLDRLEFTPLRDQKELKTDFSWGWFIRREDGVFFCKNSATLDIYNNSVPHPINLTFQGRLVVTQKTSRELYKKEVEYMDKEIGKLWEKLKEFKLINKSAICIVGDHGEGLGEYTTSSGINHFGHIHYLYNVYMKVPLILYNPFSSKKGVREKKIVTLLDIAPTVANILGIKELPPYQGRDILRLDRNERLTFFEETYRPEAVRNRFGVLDYPWHLIFTPEENRYELFDLKHDPQEWENIFPENGTLKEVIGLKQKLDSFAREVLKTKEDAKLDKKTEKMLKTLGYIR
jgi:arylsulfatase A-like enzyme